MVAGDRAVVDRLMPVIYDELRRLAESHLQREKPDHTLQATALVHEAFLKLIDQKQTTWESRAHFLSIAATAIRRILVDHARAKKRIKRGGGRAKIQLNEMATISRGAEAEIDTLDDLDRALTKLSEEDPKKARVVELKFFGGMTNDETATVLGVTTRTVERYWQYARARLYQILNADNAST
jgi:RNA polymerase sigma factor (TIGR02999 family)